MPAAARIGDTAGGAILTTTQSFVRIGGVFWAQTGATIASHGSGSHVAATLNQGSTFVSIDGVAPSLVGHTATCGHTVTNGSDFVSAGE